MPMEPSPDLATLSLAEIAQLAADKRLPPVEKWHPTHCGDSEMRIARDGTWFHRGSPIRRPEMVRLFSTILRREPDGGYVLVTPVEKLDVAVEDAPFVAVAMTSQGQGREASLTFQLNTGDLVTAGAGHPLRIEQTQVGPRPYLHVRGGLDALVGRSVYYDIAERALAGDDLPGGIWSNGAFFALEPAA